MIFFFDIMQEDDVIEPANDKCHVFYTNGQFIDH